MSNINTEKIIGKNKIDPQKILDGNSSKTAKIVIIVAIVSAVIIGISLGIYFYIEKKKK